MSKTTIVPIPQKHATCLPTLGAPSPTLRKRNCALNIHPSPCHRDSVLGSRQATCGPLTEVLWGLCPGLQPRVLSAGEGDCARSPQLSHVAEPLPGVGESSAAQLTGQLLSGDTVFDVVGCLFACVFLSLVSTWKLRAECLPLPIDPLPFALYLCVLISYNRDL